MDMQSYNPSFKCGASFYLLVGR